MSTHSTHTPTQEIGNDTYKSIDDIFSKYTKKADIVKTFSDSSSDSLKQEAKKLKKSSSLTHKEALNQIAVKKGFKSFKDCKNQFNYWKSLPPIYIYISNGTTLSYDKRVFSRLPQDDKSKSMKELMKKIMKNAGDSRFNKKESIFKQSMPIFELDNHKLGIKILNESEKEDFFILHRDLCSQNRIDREKDYIFKFIHYKLDPVEEKNKR